MNQDQIKNFFIKLEHDLTAQKRCFDLAQLILEESELNILQARKLLSETLKNFELTQNWISSVKHELLETKPEKGLS